MQVKTIRCTRIITFDSAHRVVNHESKCKYLHGHTYRAEFTFEADKLDDLGRVIDFGVIKTKLKTWIDANLDHNTILNICDKSFGEQIEKTFQQNVYYLPNNPTAENIASHLLEEICPKLFADQQNCKCIKIKLWETPNCFVVVKF
jgi:6-pyruvoyltetrahydropterin/6-carboxytetrahydropterin synthase